MPSSSPSVEMARVWPMLFVGDSLRENLKTKKRTRVRFSKMRKQKRGLKIFLKKLFLVLDIDTEIWQSMFHQIPTSGNAKPKTNRPTGAERSKMSAIKITDQITITTDHPASHYGSGVMLAFGNGVAYGPSDMFPETLPQLVDLLGANHFSCAEIIVSAIKRDPEKFGSDQIAQIKRWLSQHPAPNVFERL